MKISVHAKAFFCFLLYAIPVFGYASGKFQFIENKGQLPANIVFSTKVPGGNLYFEKNCLTFDFADVEKLMHPHKENVRAKNINSTQKIIRQHSYKVHFKNANISASIKSQSATETKYNYFKGNKENNWITGVKAYETIIYNDIYKNISAKYYTSEYGNLKYDLTLQPGANVKDIQLQYEGVKSLKLVNGNLEIQTTLNQVTEQKPIAYQIINGKRKAVKCNYILSGNTLGFVFPDSYNKFLPVIIDPEIVFSTFSGSVADNFGFCATYDKYGNAYSGGVVYSAGYPVTTGAYQTTFKGGIEMENDAAQDIGILKFSPDGKNLLYATYLGGKGNEYPQSMIINTKGELVILGTTSSKDFPVSTNILDNSANGKHDIFISKLSADGTKLIASTYFGGTENDGYNFITGYDSTDLNLNYGDTYRAEMHSDENDNIVFASNTFSDNFPVKNAFQNSISGKQDACVVKINSALDSVYFSTYFGGDSLDASCGLALGDGNIYVCGVTTSPNFPVTNKVYQPVYSAKEDGFVSCFSVDGNLISSTFLATNKYDKAYLIKYMNGKVFVTGQALGKFPVSANVYSNPNSGQYIAILKNDLSEIILSTVFGSGDDSLNLVPTTFDVDACENIYFAGFGGEINNTWIIKTGSMYNLPLTQDAFQKTTNNGDFYLATFAKDLDTLTYGSYFGGNKSIEHSDGGVSHFDENGTLYLTICGGCGGRSDMPTTSGAWSSKNKGKRPNEIGTPYTSGCNQALLKINLKQAADFTYNFTSGNQDITFYGPKANTYFWDFGDGTTSTEKDPKRKFTVGKTYKVCLYINANCNADTICKEVKIWNTGLNEIENNKISVYPNPANNLVTVELVEELLSKYFSVKLYMADALGKEIITKNITSEKSIIDISELAAGLYFYTLITDNQVITNGKLNIVR